MFIKIIVSAFTIFAISRVWLRFRDHSIGTLGMITWSGLWVGVAVFAWWPKVTDYVAHRIGIGRGVDALVYFSIVSLFYIVFRLYVKMESIEHEITSLTRMLAIRRKGEKQ